MTFLTGPHIEEVNSYEPTEDELRELAELHKQDKEAGDE